ncbi:hypothetical protein KDW63_01225 [Burkholderia cenocepacia]|uniref:hypothetical protein n=1 Tax=Burkholderia cenocepacia TaxID=95486 RepID=UPI001B8EA9BD|nr:hypothetical protein [Burkholderia cenocepacia]MBR8292790.1 hypothetical protein [Burkholderia cenocepacia]
MSIIFNQDFSSMGVLMIKSGILLAIVLTSNSVCAKSVCADFRDRQSYPPLNIKGGTVCFVREPLLDDKAGAPSGLDGISLYYVASEGVPVKANGRGLLYDDTPGEVVSAFSLNVGREHQEKVFVIHFFEVRNSLVEKNSSGKFYSVSVFYSDENILYQDERSTDWFGGGYSWLSDGKRMIYKFPYQSKKDVERAIKSPFASLMSVGGEMPVYVKLKSYLFDGPNVKGRTRKYLIAGDRAVVEGVTAGWCQVNYLGATKPIDMWLMCNALGVDAQEKRVN